MQHQQHTAETKHEPAPLQRRDALTEKAARKNGRQDRLQARNDRREADRHLMRNRQYRASEIEPLHQKSGDDVMADAGTIRPDRPREQHDDAHDRGRNDHPHREIGQRLRTVEDIFGPDEAGAPEQHEQHGRGRGKKRVCLFVRVRFHGLLSAS